MRRGRRAAKRYCTLASSTRVGKGGRKQKHEAKHESDGLAFQRRGEQDFQRRRGQVCGRLGTKQSRYLQCRRCPNCVQMSPDSSSEGVGYTCHPPLMHTRSQTCSLILYEGRVCDMPPRGSCAHARQLMLRFATTNYRLTDARIKYKR